MTVHDHGDAAPGAGVAVKLTVTTLRPPASSAAVAQRMSVVRRRDTQPELALRRELHARGRRFRVDVRPIRNLRGRADIVFTRRRVAVYVDGCFWHGCPEHGVMPKSNRGWWMEKIAATKDRDRRAEQALHADGWKVVRVWEHEHPSSAADRVEAVLDLPAASVDMASLL